MTVNELIKELQKVNGKAEVVVETRVRTGCGEGDIYHNDVDNVSIFKTGTVRITLRGFRQVGGW
jgi:hypothetical protein